MYELVAAPLDEFLEHLNLSSTPDETELLRILDAATAVAETDEECGVGPIIRREITRRVNASTGRAMLPWTPAVELVEFAGVRGGSSYDVDDLDLDIDTGIVRSATGRLNDGAYDVTYVAGLADTVDDVTSNLRLAVCIIGKHLWETQRGRGQARGGALATTGPVQDERVPAGFLIPHRARSLLLGQVEWVPLA